MSDQNRHTKPEPPSRWTGSALPSVTAAVCLTLLPLAAGAWLAFPNLDDAWLALLAKEKGTDAVGISIRHRPLIAALWTLLYPSEAFCRAAGVGLHILLWLVYALETAWLWKMVFPEFRRYAAVPACLILAPVVAATHLSTVTVLLPINLTAVMSYGALLLLLRYTLRGGSNLAALAGAAALISGGMLFSEYAIAPVLAALALLGGVLLTGSGGDQKRRVWISASVTVAATVVGLAAFRLTADFSTRTDATMGSMIGQIFADLPGFAFNAVNAVWRSVIGGPAEALSAVRLVWGEKSTIAGCLYGSLVAAVLLLACRASAPGEQLPRPWICGWKRLAALLAALAGALWPELVRQGLFRVGRLYEIEFLSTRFFLAALPVAACLTVWLACGLAEERFRKAPVALLGMLIGYSVFLHSYSEYRKHRPLNSLGVVLRPYVEAQQGVTVAVLPDYYGREYEMIYKVARSWPPELSRRLFLVWEGRFPTFFKQIAERSGACPTVRGIDINLSGITRQGPIGQLLFVEGHKNGSYNIEPFCVAPVLPPSSAPGAADASALIRTDTAAPMPPLP